MKRSQEELETYKEFQKAFKFLNQKLFNDELPHCVITLSRKSRTYGFYVNQLWEKTSDAKQKMCEISLNPDHFKDRSNEETLSTLAHEMAHQWQFHFGKPSGSGYHNTEWASKMIAIGLQPSDTGKEGGKITGHAVSHYIIEDGPFDKAVSELIKKGFKITWKPGSLSAAQKRRKKAKTASKTKFTCPDCGQAAWGKPSLHITCGDCEIKLVPANPIAKLSEETEPEKKGLTVLSFGGGQDSTAILLKAIKDRSFRKKYAPNHLIVVMSDTGNEHDYTYEHVHNMEKMCKKYLIPFFFLTSDKGYHTPAWMDLIEPQDRKKGSPFVSTMVQTGTKSCTDKLKLVPIYKFLDRYINEKYDYGFKVMKNGGCDKRAIKRYYEEYGHLRVLIGFAKGEEKRAIKSIQLQESQREQHINAIAKGKAGNWQHIIERIFPLIDEEMDRKACVNFIEKTIGYEVMPSNCMLCPYQSPAELLWLAKNHPDMWKKWVKIEKNKLARFKHLEGTIVKGKPFKNHGVYNSKKLLPERLQEAKKKFGHLTEKELHEYKKYHGCQTNVF